MYDFIYGINTTNGAIVYTAEPLPDVTKALCFKYGSISAKLYGVASLNSLNTQLGLFILFGDGKTRPKKLLDFPVGWTMENIGTCEIARESQTFFALMRNASESADNGDFPKVLFSVDLVTLTVETHNVSAFAEGLHPYQWISQLKYVPNSQWIDCPS